MNWINSWKSRTKKRLYRIELRLGKLTALEIEFCPCIKGCTCKNKTCKCKKCSKLRVMIFNFGFEI